MAQKWPTPIRRRNLLAATAAAVGFFVAFLFQLGPARGVQIDFFIYYSGVRLAWAGEWPYDTSKIHKIVEHAFPPAVGDQPLDCGFFLSPQGFLLLAPWAAMPWGLTRWAWIGTSMLGALSCGSLAETFGRDEAHRARGWGLLAAAISLNPLILRAVSLGQTGLFIVGCLAAGQYAREKGRPRLGLILWSACGLKPHEGLAFLLFLTYQGGLRRASMVAIAVVLEVAIGAALLGNPARVIWDYGHYLGPAHQSVGFNRVTNDQMTSWNRVVAAAGGPHIELSAPEIVAGIAVAAGLLWAVRVRNRERPSDSWALAATVAWSPLVTPLLAYELVLWALMCPYFLKLADRRRWADLALLLALVGIASIPRAVVASLASDRPAIAPLMLSYRALIVLVMAMYYLLRHPVSPGGPAKDDEHASSDKTGHD